MNFCLTLTQIDTLKARLKETGAKNVVEMSSKDRLEFFTSALENSYTGRQVATSFEKAMISKQKKSLVKWANDIFTEKEKKNPNFFKVINRIDSMTKKGILSPRASDQYLETLVSTELGVDVEAEEIKKINELATKIAENKAELEADPSSEENRIAYGQSIIDAYDYVQTIAPLKSTMLENVANLPKSMMSTLDFSAPFRQGWGMMSRPEFYKALVPMFKYAFSENAYKKIQADIISRPNYEAMKRGGLRISILADKLTQREEDFMSNLVGKVPAIGKFMKGSERAYTGFLSKLRADVFDTLIEKAKLAGENVDPKSQTVKDLAAVVNNFTGSGNLGANDRYSGAVPLLNATFFAPRKISATMNMFNPVNYLNPKISPTAKKAAIRQLAGSLALSTTIILLHSLLSGDDDELDPRSADFGKIKDGNTRFDVTGGNAGYLVMLSRIFTNETKSSTTGLLTELGAKFGSDTKADVLIRFFRNKLSPTASYFADALYGSNTVGDEFSPIKDAAKRFIPLILQNIVSAAQEDEGNLLIATMAEMFGISTQNYAEKEPKPKRTAEQKIEDAKEKANKTAIKQIVLYAKAISVDPATAFKRLIQLEAIKSVEDGIVKVYRPDVADTQAIKEARGGNNTDMKLDHTVPLELGGSNSEDNLKLVPTAVWKKYTPVENFLKKRVTEGKLTAKEARKAIEDFKNGKITEEDIKIKY